MKNNTGEAVVTYLKAMIVDEVHKYRPEFTEKEIFDGLASGRIKITVARHSNWPFGSPMIPPKVEIEA